MKQAKTTNYHRSSAKVLKQLIKTHLRNKIALEHTRMKQYTIAHRLHTWNILKQRKNKSVDV